MQPKQISEGERRDRELIKNWLSFLPEIKQEVQFYLGLPQNKKIPSGAHRMELLPFLELTQSRKVFSRLQECASRLENLPSVEEILKETDTQKLHWIFTEFESAKLAARLAILAIRTNLELGLEDYGLYIIPDTTQHKLKDFTVTHSWTVNILPFAYVPARIVVSFQKTHYQIAFGVCLSPEGISTSVIKIDLPHSWTDPLEKPVHKLNLFQSQNQLSLDGIEYELTTISETSKATLWFGNPSTSPLIEIERAFFSIAEMIVNEKGQIAERNYLVHWQRYLAQPKNA